MGESTLIKNNKVKKILNITFYVVLFIVFAYAIFGLFSEKDENSISFLGITSMSVQSDSMSPTFEKGDLIFVNTDFNPDDLNKDDVITYRETKIVDGKIVYYYNTHRIVEKIDFGTRIQFITKGDNEDRNDPFIWEDDIYAVWTGKSVANFGGFVDGFTGFLKSSLGFFLFIVVPCLALLAYEIIKFMKVYAEYNVQKSKEDRVKLQEEALAAARAQLEAEAQLKAEKETKDQQE